MDLINKIKSYFKRKEKQKTYCDFNNHEIEEKKSDDIPDTKSDVVFTDPDLSSEGLELNKVPDKLPPEKTSKKKNKTKIIHSENRKKIRKISSNEDLYELFTGEQNPGVREYSVSVSSQLSAPGRNCRKDAKLRQRKVIDLHGLSSYEAERKIESSIIVYRQKGMGSIQFITGKGKHSKNMKPVLRSLAEKKAVELKKSGKICSFEWEKKHKKKSGSIIIYL